jgi:hypothetical protein
MAEMTGPALLRSLVGVVAFAGILLAAERAWQEGVWRGANVDRPLVTFGVGTRDPATGLPRAASTREIRTYVIETATDRLELRQEATTSTPRLDVVVGGAVLVAIEKKTAYVKDAQGREHKLALHKQSALSKKRN